MEHENVVDRLNRLEQLSDAECLELASEVLADASMGIVVHAIKIFGRRHNVAKYLNQRRPSEEELARYEAWMVEAAGALENFYLTDLIVRLRDVIAPELRNSDERQAEINQLRQDIADATAENAELQARLDRMAKSGAGQMVLCGQGEISEEMDGVPGLYDISHR